MSGPPLRNQRAPGLLPGPSSLPLSERLPNSEADITKTFFQPMYHHVWRVDQVQKPPTVTSFDITIAKEGLLVWIPTSKFPKDSSIRAKIGLQPPSATENEGAWYRTFVLNYAVWRAILDAQQEEDGMHKEFYRELLRAIWTSVQRALDAADNVYFNLSGGRLDGDDVNNLEVLNWAARCIKFSGKKMSLVEKGNTISTGIYVWQDWDNSWMFTPKVAAESGGKIKQIGNWMLDGVECTLEGVLFRWERVKFSFGACKRGMYLVEES